METTKKKTQKKHRKGLIILIVLLLLAAAATAVVLWMKQANSYDVVYWQKYGIRPVHSDLDADGDGIDDYLDFMQSARAYIETNPDYVSEYFADGYPPEGQGVCTDVIWRGLKGAGYDFKSMVDEDIAANQSLYPLEDGKLDPNIDFRRVVNLMVYFDRHCQALTLDTSETDQWQGGDIVIYEGHVAVVSDIRNEEGHPWIIHHAGNGAREADELDSRPIIGHYRWPSSKDMNKE